MSLESQAGVGQCGWEGEINTTTMESRYKAGLAGQGHTFESEREGS